MKRRKHENDKDSLKTPISIRLLMHAGGDRAWCLCK